PSAKGDDKFITTDYLQQCHQSYTFSISHPDCFASGRIILFGVEGNGTETYAKKIIVCLY
ncbi:hypothetical protein ACRFAB_27725, partial [Klebsiella pneumoniae]